MNKLLNIALAILSSLIGFYSGFIIALVFIIFLLSLLTSYLDLKLGIMGLAVFGIGFILAVCVGLLVSILLGMLSWGMFDSKKWRINRHILILAVLLIALFTHFVLPLFLVGKTN